MAKLTEQDILNWNGPEEDYMNNDHLEFFRERLLTMQRELLSNATATTSHLQEQEATPIPPTGLRSKRNMRWNCVPAIVNASCCKN